MFLTPRFVDYVLQVSTEEFIGYVLSICLALFCINIFCIANYICEKYNNSKKGK